MESAFQLNRTYYRCLAALFLLIGLMACSQDKRTPTEYDLYLVRHFEKAKPEFSGDTDVHLTGKGSANAVKLANIMTVHDVKMVFSTQYKRTIQTAQPTANALGIAIQDYWDLDETS